MNASTTTPTTLAPTNTAEEPTTTTSTAPSPPSPTNDNSNPQQGTGAEAKPTSAAMAKEDDKTLNHPAALRRAPLKIPPTKKDERKLFVGGLPADVTEDEFHAFFEQFGEVLDSVVMYDRDTGRSRGFGFVTFCDAQVSRHLLGDGPVARMQMRDKTIEIKASQPKERATPRNRHGVPLENINHQHRFHAPQMISDPNPYDVSYPPNEAYYHYPQYAPQQPHLNYSYYYPPMVPGYNDMTAAAPMYYAPPYDAHGQFMNYGAVPPPPDTMPPSTVAPPPSVMQPVAPGIPEPHEDEATATTPPTVS